MANGRTKLVRQPAARAVPDRPKKPRDACGPARTGLPARRACHGGADRRYPRFADQQAGYVNGIKNLIKELQDINKLLEPHVQKTGVLIKLKE